MSPVFKISSEHSSLKNLKEYKIPFLGLKTGIHRYQYKLTGAFFENFELSQIENCDIDVNLDLEKQASMMLLHFHLTGTVQVSCDHCGDEITQPIDLQQDLVVKFGEETEDAVDELLILGPREHELDVSQFVYEYAHLAIPIRHVHASEADCNQQTLKALEKYKTTETGDTKWASLKDLNFETPGEPEDFDQEEEE